MQVFRVCEEAGANQQGENPSRDGNNMLTLHIKAHLSSKSQPRTLAVTYLGVCSKLSKCKPFSDFNELYSGKYKCTIKCIIRGEIFYSKYI